MPPNRLRVGEAPHERPRSDPSRSRRCAPRRAGPRRAASSTSSTTAATRKGLIPLWVGEGDLPTPAFICEAATRSLAAGETFYTYQRGIPDLRQALARYIERLYGRPSDPERFFVTAAACTRSRSPCA